MYLMSIGSAAHAVIAKTKLESLLDNVTSIPATAAQAFAQCSVDEGAVKAGPAMEKITTELERLIKQTAVPYGMDDGKTISEGDAKSIKAMSKQDKIAMAMKMAAQMGGAPMKVADTQLWGDCIALTNELAALGGDLSFHTKLGEAEKESDAVHDAIHRETAAAVKTCPWTSSGEMSAQDPACIKARNVAGADNHIEAEIKTLATIKAVLAERVARIKPLLVRGDQLLEKSRFGESVDAQSKTIISQMQGQAINQILLIQTQAQNACVEAAKWIQARNDMAKQ